MQCNEWISDSSAYISEVSDTSFTWYLRWRFCAGEAWVQPRLEKLQQPQSSRETKRPTWTMMMLIISICWKTWSLKMVVLNLHWFEVFHSQGGRWPVVSRFEVSLWASSPSRFNLSVIVVSALSLSLYATVCQHRASPLLSRSWLLLVVAHSMHATHATNKCNNYQLTKCSHVSRHPFFFKI